MVNILEMIAQAQKSMEPDAYNAWLDAVCKALNVHPDSNYPPESGSLVCCVIDCAKPAEFEITGDCGAEDTTHACVDHVGDLLGTPEGAPRENKRWNVADV